jgi:hypothetical protein
MLNAFICISTLSEKKLERERDIARVFYTYCSVTSRLVAVAIKNAKCCCNDGRMHGGFYSYSACLPACFQSVTKQEQESVQYCENDATLVIVNEVIVRSIAIATCATTTTAVFLVFGTTVRDFSCCHSSAAAEMYYDDYYYYYSYNTPFVGVVVAVYALPTETNVQQQQYQHPERATTSLRCCDQAVREFGVYDTTCFY